MRRFREIRIGRITDSSRIYDLKRNRPLAADSGKSVARHSGLVVDNGHPLPHQAVEEGGFAHIGATDNGYASHEIKFVSWDCSALEVAEGAEGIEDEGPSGRACPAS